MRLDAIRINNLLSFDHFEWTNLDPRVNLIVGPNGVGKTNFFQALRAVSDTLNYMRRPELPWEQSFHRGGATRAIRIELDVVLTGAWERQLLSTLVGASLCEALRKHSSFNSNQIHRQELPGLSAFVAEHVRPEDLEWLFTGRLVVSYGEISNRWHSWYQSRPEAPFFQLLLDSPLGASTLLGDEVLQQLLEYLIAQGWHPTLLQVETPPVQAQQSVSSPQQEGKPDPSSPAQETALSELDTPPAQPEPQFDGARLLSHTSQGKGLYLEINYPQEFLLATHQVFEQVAGETLETNKSFNAMYVFRRLVERAFVFTDNLRRMPKHGFTLAELRSEPSELSNGEGLAKELFRKMTGRTQSERDEYTAIRETFNTLTRKEFALGLSYPSQLPQARPSSTTVGDMLIDIFLTSHWGDLPLEFSGAGFTEVLFLSTLIASENDQVVLLDEPALNLHPTMQKKLLDQLLAHTGNQFIIVTHSPALIPSDHLARVSRFFLTGGKTRRAALGTGLAPTTLAKLERELRGSTDVRSMLFSRGVILVEGDTEQEVLPLWFEKHFGQAFDNQDVLVYSVGGHTHFEPYVRFLQQLKVPWAIVCDGPIIHDDGPKGLARQLARAGVEELPDIKKMAFGQRVAALAPYGVLTLASEDTHEIEHAPSIKQLLNEAAKHMRSQNKVRRGRYIAEKYPCPEEVALLLERAVQHLMLREMAIGAGEDFALQETELPPQNQGNHEEVVAEEENDDAEFEDEFSEDVASAS